MHLNPLAFDSHENTAGASLPCRSEMDPAYQWDLSHLFSNEEAWEQGRQHLQALLPQISACQGTLHQSTCAVAACFALQEEADILAGRLYAYARMHRDQDASCPRYQAWTAQMESLLAQVAAAQAFIEPELLSLPADALDELMQTEELRNYTFYFEKLARRRAHVLSPQEEALLAQTSELAAIPLQVFTMLARADMRFPQLQDENEQPALLSEGRYAVFLTSPNRRVRQQAFEGLMHTYAQYRNTLTATLSGHVKHQIFAARSRRYAGTLEAALAPDQIELAVYDNLLHTVEQHLPALHRYVEMKRRHLQLDAVHMYDLYAPLVPQAKFHIPYSHAQAMVKKALAPLGKEYTQQLQYAFENRWLDVYENAGKQSGAYSWGTYGCHPYILLNYQNQYNDLSTLAHELGHTMHSYYSHASHPYITADYTIFTAEVASTTNEILLAAHMQKIFEGEQRLFLINQQLESIRATVYRQTLFAEFEKSLYKEAEAGQALTADYLETLWASLNQKYYGPDIIVDAANAIEWARIPHFYRTFYVYQYATGYSAAHALAIQLLAGGVKEQEQYLRFLRSGGGAYPLQQLRDAGVDMASPLPISQTLEHFDQLLDHLEAGLSPKKSSS